MIEKMTKNKDFEKKITFYRFLCLQPRPTDGEGSLLPAFSLLFRASEDECSPPTLTK